MKKIAVGDLGEFWYGDYKEPFEQLEGGVPGYPQGTVLKDDDGKLLCAYCGKTFDNLGAHVKKHGFSGRAYKEEVGLLQKSALVSERERVRMLRKFHKLDLGRSLREASSTTLGEWARSGGKKSAATRQRKRVPQEKLNMTGRCHAQVLTVARQLRSEGRLSKKALAKVGITEATVRGHFGSFDGLRIAAGASRRSNAGWSDALLLQALASLAAELGRTPFASDLRRFGLPWPTTYVKHFGSWNDACAAAGLPPNIPKSFSLGDKDHVDMLSRWAAGSAVSTIAKSLHVDRLTVSKVLNSYGVITHGTNYDSALRKQSRQHAANIAASMAEESA